MTGEYDLERMAHAIEKIIAAAKELKEASAGVPALKRNAEAILTFAHIAEDSLPPGTQLSN